LNVFEEQMVVDIGNQRKVKWNDLRQDQSFQKGMEQKHESNSSSKILKSGRTYDVIERGENSRSTMTDPTTNVKSGYCSER
jgi:hypothetical protein